MQSRTHNFDANLGLPEDANWLDKKVMRREATEGLKRQSMDIRAEKATDAAQKHREDLSRKAELRDGIEKRCEELRQRQQEALRQQALEYRKRLRKYLRPELRDS